MNNIIQKFWTVGHERTLNIKKNILYSFLIKGLGILVGFILVPLIINYVNTAQYGIWLTIYALVAWVNTFDIGLSNGLRNKLAASIVLKEDQNITRYVSTTYILLFFIALTTFVLFFIVGSFFDWNQLLKVGNTIDYKIWPVILITLGFFCIQFVLQPINSILTATQQPFKSSLIFLAGQLLTLVITYILTLCTNGNLFILVLVAAGCPALSLLFGTLYFFRSGLKSFIPRFSTIDIKSAKNLLNLGGAFFLVQVGALILYETDNIIITRTLGPSEVTTFNVAYKYFAILTIAFNIILTPYWNAFTEAYAKNDFSWIRQSIKKLRLIWLSGAILAVFLYLFSNIFYRIWVGDKIVVPNMLSLSLAIYVIVQNWMVIHTYFLNGTGKLRIQLILVISTGIINIPLSVLLINHVGISGTVIANVAVMLVMGILFTYQSQLVINRTATGIWNK